MDIKLGTALYDVDASEEKRARMEKKAREGTSLETGLRLTSFQLYDHDKQSSRTSARDYGRSLKPPQLPGAIAQFFPTASSVDVPTGEGLPSKLLLPIIRGIKAEVEKIKLALEPLDLTMIGSSLLIIYEADWERAAEGFEFLSRHASDDEGEDEDEDDEEPNAVEGPDAPSRLSKQGPPYRVRLIDFAHTRFVPGHGPDQGVLKGINSLLTILDGIIGDVSEEKP